MLTRPRGIGMLSMTNKRSATNLFTHRTVCDRDDRWTDGKYEEEDEHSLRALVKA